MAPSSSVGQTGGPGRGWSEGTARKPSRDAEDTGWSGGKGCAPESRVQSSPGHDPSRSPQEAGFGELGAGGPCLAELPQRLFVPPKGAGSVKQEAASLASLATQAHISSARVAPKRDGGGEVTDSSPLPRVFLYRMTECLAPSGRNF